MVIQALLFLKAETNPEISSNTKESERKKECSNSKVFDHFTLVNYFWRRHESLTFLRPIAGVDEVNYPPGSNFEMVEILIDVSQCSLRERLDIQTIGDATIVKNLHNVGAEPEQRLHVDEYNLDVVTRLFPNDTKFKFDTDFKSPATDLVLCGKNISVIEKLLQSGVSISYRNNGDDTLAHYVAKRSSISLIPVLLKYGEDLNVVGSDGRTPLHIAVQKKSLEIVRALLDNGANPNGLTADGHSPLYLAVQGGFSDAGIVLIENGADVNAVDEEKPVLFDHFFSLVSEMDASKIIEILLSVGLDFNSVATFPAVLINAVERKAFELVQKLLEHGACPHQKHILMKPYIYGLYYPLNTEVYETTAIHVACACGDEKIVKLLLDHGADANVVCGPKKVDSPIVIAIRKSNSKIVSLLLKHGVIVCDRPGLLKLALQYDCPPYNIMRSLLDNGCFNDILNDLDKGKPILSTYTESNKESFKLMMKYGGDLDFRDLALAIRDYPDMGCYEDDEFLNVFFACSFTDMKEFEEAMVRELFSRVSAEGDWNYIEDGPEDPPRKEPSGMLAKHMVKLSVAGKKINESVIPEEFNDPFELGELRAECEVEIERTKRKMVGETGISFYDVLMKTANTVSRYLKNRNTRLMLTNYKFKEEFPNYGRIIKYRVRQAEWRREFLIEGMKSFNGLVLRLPRLPFELKENILDLLSIQDFVRLKLCFPVK